MGHVYEDNCCGCGTGACRAVKVEGWKYWPGYAPFPLYVRGSWRWDYGGDGTAFLAAMSSAGFNADGPMNHKGIFGTGPEDPRLLKRYRTILCDSSGNTLYGFPPVLTAWGYTYRETYHRWSGLFVLALGEDSCGTWYSYTLDDAGVETTSGATTGWFGCPVEGFPSLSNWQLALTNEVGSFATLTVTENTADFYTYAGTSGEVFHFTVTLSDEYTVEAALADAETMMDLISLTDLPHTYDGTEVDWENSYVVTYEHAVGTPLALVYGWAGGSPEAVTEWRYFKGQVFGNVRGYVWTSKTRAELNNQSSSLYSEEQTIPIPSTIPPPDDNGSEDTFPGQTDCVLDFASGTEITLQPGDIPYAFGRSALQRDCTGSAPCEP